MELPSEVLYRALPGALFLPALCLLGRRSSGSWLTGLLLGAVCAALFVFSPNAALVFYAFVCGLVYGEAWDRGLAIATAGVLGLILLELLCVSPMDFTLFPQPTHKPLIAPVYAVPLKLVLLLGLPHLVLRLWPIRVTDIYGNELKTARSREESIAAQCKAVLKCSREGADGQAAIPWILQLLRLSPEEEVRHTCIVALQRIGSSQEAVIEALTQARETPDSERVRTAAEEALRNLTS